MQIRDFFRHDHAATAAEYLDVCAAAFFQQVDHVLEIFDMAALVTGDRDALRVLLQCGGNDLIDRAVVSEMDHFGAIGHQNAAHDVDRGVMTVEQRCGGDEAHLVGGLVFGQALRYGKIGHCYLRILEAAADKRHAL